MCICKESTVLILVEVIKNKTIPIKLSTKLVTKKYLLPRELWFFIYYFKHSKLPQDCFNPQYNINSICRTNFFLATLNKQFYPHPERAGNTKMVKLQGPEQTTTQKNCLSKIVLSSAHRRRGRMKLRKVSVWTGASSVLCLPISCALTLFQYNCRHKLGIFSKSTSFNSWFSLFNQVITI